MNTIITGATKGIGRALALKFASEGHNLGICARNASELMRMKDEILGLYPRCDVFTAVADVSKKEDVLQFAKEATQHFETIDVLINNAGIFIPGAIREEADGALELMMNTNLYSAYHLTRAILPSMANSIKAHIFNMCSIASFTAYPNGGSYSISKFALLGFTKVLRAELKDQNIRVTAIMPGATWSDSWKGADFPEDRLMDATDIADIIWSAYQLQHKAVIEEIVIRPQLGDL
ncbi:MAG: SDR family oxidoreductase [Chitinophagales bacterium]|nr:SDR family oxidoreductase [Chitinophagales bacterium]